MSQHWHNLRIAGIEEARSVSEALAQIAQEDPKLAAELASVDWIALRKHAMGRALQDAATALGAALHNAFDNTSFYGSQSGDPTRGTCVGVLYDHVFLQLGVSMEEDGVFHFFWNQGADERHASELARWKAAVQEAFEKRLLETALQVLATDVITQTQADGSLIAVGTLRSQS